MKEKERIWEKISKNKKKNIDEKIKKKSIDKGIEQRSVKIKNEYKDLVEIIKKLVSRSDKYESANDILIDLSKSMYEKARVDEKKQIDLDKEIKIEYNKKYIKSQQ